MSLLNAHVPKGAVVLDIGAGNGALCRRIIDAGFKCLPVDQDCSEWLVDGVKCIEAEVAPMRFEDYLQESDRLGAICMIEVLEHLENPRAAICLLAKLAKEHRVPIIVSTPNRLDTFSCGSVYRGDCFNSFSPDYYEGSRVGGGTSRYRRILL